MGAPRGAGLTYDDLRRLLPETNLFVELIDGELVVTGAPAPRHQLVVTHLIGRILPYVEEHGGVVLPGPVDVIVEPRTIVQPDVLVLRAERVPDDLVKPLTIPPDLVVEVLSPSNRAHDLVRKRAIYERFGVPELWFVDLDGRQVEQLGRGPDGRYGTPGFLGPGAVLRSLALSGLELDATGILGPPT